MITPHQLREVRDSDDLSVKPWEEPFVGAGWFVTSPEAERFWLPALGPTTYLLARRLLDFLGQTVSKADLAHELGVTHRGRNSALERSLRRLQSFGGCKLSWDGTVYVRTSLPPLGPHQVTLLTPRLRAAYDAALD